MFTVEKLAGDCSPCSPYNLFPSGVNSEFFRVNYLTFYLRHSHFECVCVSESCILINMCLQHFNCFSLPISLQTHWSSFYRCARYSTAPHPSRLHLHLELFNHSYFSLSFPSLSIIEPLYSA